MVEDDLSGIAGFSIEPVVSYQYRAIHFYSAIVYSFLSGVIATTFVWYLVHV